MKKMEALRVGSLSCSAALRGKRGAVLDFAGQKTSTLDGLYGTGSGVAGKGHSTCLSPRLLWLAQREIRDLWDVHPFSHQERALLLRQQKDILSMQRSMARLQQDLWAWTRRLQVGAHIRAKVWACGQETLSPAALW